MNPRADERSEPIVTTWHSPRVRHLPLYPGTRKHALFTLCGKQGWFWRRRSIFYDKPPGRLPLCAECKRRRARWSKAKKNTLGRLLKDTSKIGGVG